MTASRLFTDEELTAYLDHEIDPAIADTISLALETDVALQQRIQKLDTLTNNISIAFDGLLASAPAMPEMSKMAAPKSRTAIVTWGRTAGIAAALAIGVMTGYFSFGQERRSSEGWMDYVAAYQALYINETLSSVDISDEEKTAQLTKLGQMLKRDLSSAQRPDEIEFRRAQLLGFQDKPLVQMAFLSRAGTPIALCVIKVTGSAETTPELTTLEGMSASHWTKEGYSFLLIGGKDEGLIEREAKYFFETI